MKQLMIPRLYFYMYMIMCMIGWCSHVEAFDYSMRPLCDQDILEAYTTLKVIKRAQRDIEDQFDQLPEEEQSIQQDFIVDIMVVLIGMYEKIVAATVTNYLLMNTPGQQNLQDVVARIIAEDVVKIIAILGKQILSFIFSQRMTWQEKLWYCAWVTSVILIIKFAIGQVAKSYKIEQNINSSPYENQWYNQQASLEKSSLVDKFNGYK